MTSVCAHPTHTHSISFNLITISSGLHLKMMKPLCRTLTRFTCFEHLFTDIICWPPVCGNQQEDKNGKEIPVFVCNTHTHTLIQTLKRHITAWHQSERKIFAIKIDCEINVAMKICFYSVFILSLRLTENVFYPIETRSRVHTMWLRIFNDSKMTTGIF